MSTLSVKPAHTVISGEWLGAHVRYLGGGWWAVVSVPCAARVALRLQALGASRVAAKGVNVRFQGSQVALAISGSLVSCPLSL